MFLKVTRRPSFTIPHGKTGKHNNQPKRLPGHRDFCADLPLTARYLLGKNLGSTELKPNLGSPKTQKVTAFHREGLYWKLLNV
jgi:hypothetical protein